MMRTQAGWRMSGIAAALLVTGWMGSASAAPSSGALAAVPSAVKQEAGKLSYARVGTAGATARNLYDQQGLAVLELPAGTVLAVHGERSGWLDVEVPGGFKVWVFGEYVRAASEAGTLQITGDHVRMRPLPSSGAESLPLRQHLSRGDRVRMIRRNNSTLDLRQDWVQIWSPAGARAWVPASKTVALGAGDDGPKLWATAVVGASARPVSKPAAVPASAPAKSPVAEARKVTDLMRIADARLQSERAFEEAGGSPNYGAVVAAYEAVLAVSDGGPTADVARGRIQLAQSYAEVYAIRVELEQGKAGLAAALEKRDQERAAARERGVYEGRFGSRGWLETMETDTGEQVWILHWSGERVAEVICSTGRYDLSIFADYEIGIDGDVVRGPLTGMNEFDSRPRQVDVSRIEVLSGRKGR